MMLSKHLHYVGFEIDSVCFDAWLSPILEALGRQVFDEDLDIKALLR